MEQVSGCRADKFSSSWDWSSWDSWIEIFTTYFHWLSLLFWGWGGFPLSKTENSSL